MKNNLRGILHAAFAALLVLNFAGFTTAQEEFPKRIRGYKVYAANLLILSAEDNAQGKPGDEIDSLVKVGKPQKFQISLSGAAFEIPVTMNIYKTAGKVESISFEDVRVNGFKLNVQDVNQPFEFSKGNDIVLEPLKIKIELLQDPRPLLNLRPPFNEVEITGKVYVFGRFKKLGMSFKRVIPANFKLKTKIDLPFAGVK